MKQTFFFLDLNNCIASPALFLLSNQPQMTFGRRAALLPSPSPRGPFAEYFPPSLGSWLLNPFVFFLSFFLFVQVSNFIQFTFYSISGYKVCRSGLSGSRLWRAGHRFPPKQIKAPHFRGERGPQGPEPCGAGGWGGTPRRGLVEPRVKAHRFYMKRVADIWNQSLCQELSFGDRVFRAQLQSHATR